MQDNTFHNSPFRQKIFDLMKNSETSKIIKMSKKLYQTANSPLKRFNISQQINNQSKIQVFDESNGMNLIKSMLKQTINNTKKNQSYERCNSPSFKKSQKQKNKSFHKSLTLKYLLEKPTKSQSKNLKSLKKQSLNTSTSFLKHKSQQRIKKSRSNKGLNKNEMTQSKSKIVTQRKDNESEAKNYLVQTLKKMQSLKKNLSKTFQQLGTYQKSKDVSANKMKPHKSELIDYIQQQRISQQKQQTSHKMYRKQKNSENGLSKQKSPYKKLDFNQKKTPSKSNYLNQSFQQNSSSKKVHLKKAFLKQLISSCKNPQKWQSILSNDLISVHFRIVKKKLIEIQLHAQQPLELLDIQLVKGAFQCQSIKQSYPNVKRKEIITLLASVRSIDLNSDKLNLFSFPQILINLKAKVQQHTITYTKQVQLPYSWIMLAQTKRIDSLKKSPNLIGSRIKTRSILQNVSFKNSKQISLLKIFAFQEEPLITQTKRQKVSTNKNYCKGSYVIKKAQLSNCYTCLISIQEQQFKLLVQPCITKKTFKLSIQGRGQVLMQKLLIFLQTLS